MTRVAKEKEKSSPETGVLVTKTPEKPAVVEGGPGRHRRAFERVRRMLGWDPFETIEPLRVWRDEESFDPDFTVKETKDAYLFAADLPGVDEKDLDVSLSRNRLTVSGHREEEKKEEGETFYSCERTFGSFSRSFTLPDGADLEKVSGQLRDGVLTITVGKLVEAQPKKVAIKSS